MALTSFDPNMKEDEELAQGQPQTSNETTLGGPSSYSATGTSTAAPGSTPKPSKSGSYTNLMNYVSANNEQGGRMANAIGADTDAKATSLNQGTQNFVTEGQTAATKATVAMMAR
jgi:hypothetical protein